MGPGYKTVGNSSRMVHLDVLRAIACLLVLYLHAVTEATRALGVTSGPEFWVWYFAARVFDFGKIGVVLFFALSGYIIPPSLGSRERPVLSFVVSRFFRLYPAYWLSLAAALIYQIYYEHLSIRASVILANITMAQEALRKPDVLMVYWTLFIELVFYCLCVFHFVFGRRLFNHGYCFGWALGFLAVASVSSWVRYSTHLKVPVALLLALSIMHWSPVWRAALAGVAEARRLSRIYLATFALTMPVIGLLAYNFDAGFQESWYRYTLSYCAALSMFVVFTRFPILRWAPLAWVGMVSYSVYLFHTVITRPADALDGYRLALGSPHLYFCEVLLATLLLSWGTFTLIEKPGQRVGAMLRNYLLRPRLSSATVQTEGEPLSLD